MDGPQSTPGRYIVLEGGEGVGKTTQAEAVQRRLAAEGIDARVVREPGGDPFAEAGRELLLGELPRTAEAEVLGFNAVRAQLLLAVVRPLIERGAWVIGDRGRLSTIVYQGHARGVDLAWVRAICDATVALCPADLEVVLDLPTEQAASRRAGRGTSDRFERMDDAFHERVAQAYRDEAATAGLPVLDAGPEPAEVSEQLWSILSARLRT